MPEDARPTCLTYLPFTYNGSGVPEVAASLMPGMADVGLDLHVYIPRTRRPFAPGLVRTNQTLPLPLRYARWRHISGVALITLDRSFRAALRKADPATTVAYFWSSYLPAPSIDLVRYAGSLGIPTVREMVGTAASTAQPILQRLYDENHHPGHHFISDVLVAHEADELPLYDFVFASNPEVERSLDRVGVTDDHIVSTTFGWRRGRFPETRPVLDPDRSLRLLFVGTLELRKGIVDLLDAWDLADVDGDLLLVGGLDEALRPRLDRALATGRVQHVPYVPDIASVYRSADIFVFPTHEESGPQVTYEAAACGLPIITTPMGAARLVETGRTGTVVPSGDVRALADAIRDLARSPEQRAALGAAAQQAAEDFEYQEVGRRRGEILRRIALGEPVSTRRS